MTKFFGRILLFTTLVSATYLSIAVFPVFAEIAGGIDYKEQLLAEAESPKIVLVGGSNVAYGIDSEVISAAVRPAHDTASTSSGSSEIDRPVINMGWGAGLGLRYLLTEAQAGINEGDTVLLFLEYEHYQRNLLEGNQLLLKLLAYRPQSWAHISSPQQLIEIAPELPLVMQEKFYEILRKPPSESVAEKQANWLAAHFTEHGDYITPHPAQELIITQIRGEDGMNEEAIAVLQAFYAEVTAKGACVYYIPPPLAQTQYDYLDNADTIAHIEAQVATIAPDWMLSTATEYVFPDDFFHDTTYHLNNTLGKPERTQMILDDLATTTCPNP